MNILFVYFNILNVLYIIQRYLVYVYHPTDTFATLPPNRHLPPYRPPYPPLDGGSIRVAIRIAIRVRSYTAPPAARGVPHIRFGKILIKF